MLRFSVLDLVVHSLACHTKLAFGLVADEALLVVISRKLLHTVMTAVGKLVSMLSIKESLLIRTVEPHCHDILEPKHIWKGKSTDHVHKCVVLR